MSGRKVGRNERCPCGSGEKFKRCCAFARSVGRPQESSGAPPLATSLRNQARVDVKLGGVEGQDQRYTFVPTFRGNDPRNSGRPGGEPGGYRVVLTFARPGVRIESEN